MRHAKLKGSYLKKKTEQEDNEEGDDEEIEKRKVFMLMQATEEMIQNLEPYGIKREDVIQFLHTQKH